MQNKERNISLPLKSLLFAGGGLVIFISGVASLYFGISDGSLLFIVPWLFGPFMSLLGIVYGINAIRKNINPRSLAFAGVVVGCLSLLLSMTIIVIIALVVSGLAEIY